MLLVGIKLTPSSQITELIMEQKRMIHPIHSNLNTIELGSLYHTHSELPTKKLQHVTIAAGMRKIHTLDTDIEKHPHFIGI
jgi:hypothetical protein